MLMNEHVNGSAVPEGVMNGVDVSEDIAAKRRKRARANTIKNEKSAKSGKSGGRRGVWYETPEMREGKKGQPVFRSQT